VTTTTTPILIIGHEGGAHVGGSLLRAARETGLPALLVDMQAAYAAPRVIARLNWWLRDRRPTHLGRFSEAVVARMEQERPRLVLVTGLAPLDQRALREARRLGVPTAVFLTDDPWNPAFKSRWFLDALPFYDRVFTARRANLSDLVRHGCQAVEYLPFGYDPNLFFPDPPPEAARAGYAADVFFAGGADGDRRPFVAALLQAGFSMALYGQYWNRFPDARRFARGIGTPQDLRHAIAASKVCLGLVRRANRDGHSMRSIEVPAAGGCFLVERTAEHEELFGPAGEAVLYFDGLSDMVPQVRTLVADEPLRRRLAARAHAKIVEGGHTYRHRLLRLIGEAAA
jgi:spore maturation protein CgeB